MKRENKKAMSVARRSNQAAELARLEKSRTELKKENEALKSEVKSLTGKVASLTTTAQAGA
jgi:cell division protein FtsB